MIFLKITNMKKLLKRTLKQLKKTRLNRYFIQIDRDALRFLINSNKYRSYYKAYSDAL